MKYYNIVWLLVSLLLSACGNNNETVQDDNNNQNQDTVQIQKTTNIKSYDEATVINFKDSINSIVLPTNPNTCDCIDNFLRLYKVLDYYSPTTNKLEENSYSKEMFAYSEQKFKEINKACKGKDDDSAKECANYNALIEYNKILSN